MRHWPKGTRRQCGELPILKQMLYKCLNTQVEIASDPLVSLLRREQFAQALGVPAEQLKVKLKKDGGGAGRRQLEADLDLPRSMASWSAAQFSEWLVGLGSGAASWVALAWVLLPPLRRPPPVPHPAVLALTPLCRAAGRRRSGSRSTAPPPRRCCAKTGWSSAQAASRPRRSWRWSPRAPSGRDGRVPGGGRRPKCS